MDDGVVPPGYRRRGDTFSRQHRRNAQRRPDSRSNDVTIQLTARTVQTGEDTERDYFRVGLAENADFNGWYLVFHGGPAAPHLALPAEPVCLETDTGASTNGGIDELVLDGPSLRLVLTHAAAADLE